MREKKLQANRHAFCIVRLFKRLKTRLLLWLSSDPTYTFSLSHKYLSPSHALLPFGQFMLKGFKVACLINV